MKKRHSFPLDPSTHCIALLLLCWTGLLLALTPPRPWNVPPPPRDCLPTSFDNRASRQPAANSTRPKVTGITLKMAFDSSPAWGVAETSPAASQRFTSPSSLDMVHRLRRESCAVLVGRATVERDDCSLTVRRVRMDEGASQPVRVVLDPELNLLGGEFAVLRDGWPTLLYHRAACERDAESPPSDSVTFVGLKHRVEDQRWMLSPAEIVRDLASRGLHHVMVEGGPTTARLFLKARLVDRAILVRAPIRFREPVPAGFDEETLNDAGLTMIGTSMMGGDTVEYWTKGGTEWPSPELSLWP